jgi:uncharacterized protein YqeY
MSTKAKIENELKEAIRSGDAVRKRTLRMALSSIKLAEVERGSQLDESALIAIIHKEIKSRHESIADAERANRPELIADARQEIAVLETFLPQSLTQAELEALAKEVIDEVAATSIRDMGKVMKALMPRLQGRTTGDQASQVVRKHLE